MPCVGSPHPPQKKECYQDSSCDSQKEQAEKPNICPITKHWVILFLLSSKLKHRAGFPELGVICTFASWWFWFGSSIPSCLTLFSIWPPYLRLTDVHMRCKPSPLLLLSNQITSLSPVLLLYSHPFLSWLITSSHGFQSITTWAHQPHTPRLGPLVSFTTVQHA